MFPLKFVSILSGIIREEFLKSGSQKQELLELAALFIVWSG